MKSDELKEKSKPKRIKRSFSKTELIHRFIHSSEYMYYMSNGRKRISCYGDWLLSGDIGEDYIKNHTKEELYDNLGLERCCSIIGIINRDKKVVIVNNSFSDYAWIVSCSVPKDYTVFYTNRYLNNTSILLEENLDTALYLHMCYIRERFVDHIASKYYAVIKGIKNTIPFEYEAMFVKHVYKYDYDSICELIKKYRINKRDWYAVKPKGIYYTYVTKGWSTSYFSINLPSFKQIKERKIFNRKEQDYLNKIAYYTNYCYGFGISKKYLFDNWDKPIHSKEYNRIKNIIGVASDYSTITDECKDKTQFAIKDLVNLKIKEANEYNYNCQQESSKDYKEHLAKALELNKVTNINIWRDGDKPLDTKFVYKKFISPKKRGAKGHFEEGHISHTFYEFPNVQLRLINNRINTSKGVTITLAEGVSMWKKYIELTKGKAGIEGKEISLDFSDLNYKVNIFNLVKIKFTQKETDYGAKLDKWEWCIVIGCHKLWIDDVRRFIDYYNLNEMFGVAKYEETPIGDSK